MTDTVTWNCTPLSVVLKVQNLEEEEVKIHYSWQIWGEKNNQPTLW